MSSVGHLNIRSRDIDVEPTIPIAGHHYFEIIRIELKRPSKIDIESKCSAGTSEITVQRDTGQFAVDTGDDVLLPVIRRGDPNEVRAHDELGLIQHWRRGEGICAYQEQTPND